MLLAGSVAASQAPWSWMVRVSFVPVTRDAQNDVQMIEPSAGEGARLLDIVKRVSPDVPMRIDGQEVVLLDRSRASTTRQ